ncbi:FtsX-like permease family protein [Dactylosporangium sp. AC04546]|uniref:FtsX-like permease family protein n=1 Tax=Dactylosporangium sp. AC04546 TaxID=2862460 RepID=UPI001EDDF5C0|nr:FtsX-like permease family protein [Dactylosporangium sp. AC04546]WVK88756.1 FtsX-like permease family protein [Dactylosporangium sp. AC04546]
MSVAVQDPPLELGKGHGGMPARRAVVRWAWRLFRREWRQQAIVLTLLLLAVAATTVGLGIGANAPSEASVFGTANHLATTASTGAQLDADLATLRASFGPVDVIAHGKKIPVSGSANGVDLRAQDPDGPYGRVLLHLNQGRWPQGPDEVAVTERVATIFHLTVGGTWEQGGKRRTVVGLVENPLNLHDAFALVAPGQIAEPDHVDVLIQAARADISSKPRPDGLSIQVRSDDAGQASVVVLVLATIGLVFVGLMAVAGFTVMAQRRLRALGMLGAIGASHRHIRLVMLANGAAVGVAGAAGGAIVGVAAWVALGPRLESSLGHRIDRFNLPWTPLLVAVLLAAVTALVASWWPARAVARMPVVAALSARPAPPRPAHRFAALGGLLLVAGMVLLYVSQQTKVPYVLGGVLATAIALLLLAPAGVAAIGWLARHAPLATRLAMRDLARYRSRSSAALAAIGLAIGIAAVVALSTGVTAAKAAAPTGGNLPADQIVLWLSPEAMDGPVPILTPAQVEVARKQVDTITADLHATAVLPLTGAVDPNQPLERGGRAPALLARPHPVGPGEPGSVMYSSSDSIPLFVATPELLAHYGIDPATVGADTDLLTPRPSVAGYDLIPGRNRNWQPKLQHATLPDFGSLPNVLITTHAMTGMHLTATPVGWLVDAPQAVTAAQIDTIRQAAVAAGLNVESRPTGVDEAQLAAQFTATGIAVALGVLAMTVGLIRSETARDLRTLTAAGARRGTRRALTAATAAALALFGAVIGTACAYLALLAWYHRELHWLAQPPWLNLGAILVGLPIVAYAGGWVLAGREAPVIARQPLD